jgi:hypothetical protein
MMQTDVKSARAAGTGLLVTQIPVRLKSITVTLTPLQKQVMIHLLV